MVASLMYVSNSCMPRFVPTATIQDIVAQSVMRNDALQLRGALIFTERHFAQVLEGPAENIAAVMESIARDPRHADVTITSEKQVSDYRFPSWTLAYRGGASYMNAQVRSLLRPRDASYGDEAARLYFLIRKLAVESQLSGPIGRPPPPRK